MGYIRSLIIFILFFFSLRLCLADTLYLKNGRSITGLIRQETESDIELDVGFGTVKMEKKAIEEIYRSTPQETSAIKNRWQVNKERAEAIKNIAEEERNKSLANWREKKTQEIEQEKTKLSSQPKHVPISRERGGHIVVDAVLNGAIRATLILDTGASLVLLSKEIARKLGIDIAKEGADIQLQVADGRKINAKYVILNSIRVKDAEARNVETAVLLEDLKDSGPGDGLLGMSFLRHFNFKFDYGNEKLILEETR